MSRRQAREVALQALFQLELNKAGEAGETEEYRGMAVDACLTRTCGYRIIEAWEAPNDRLSARYIGVIAERTGTTL